MDAQQVTPARRVDASPSADPVDADALVWGHSVVHDHDNPKIKIDITHPSPPHSDKLIVEDVFVPAELRGHGLGRALARRFLKEAAARHLRVEYSEKSAPFFKALVEEEKRAPAPKAAVGADPRIAPQGKHL